MSALYTQADEVNPAVTGDRCFGCHALSHDGSKLALTLGGSYPASFQIIDLKNKSVPFTFQAPPIDMGYAAETTFNNDGSKVSFSFPKQVTHDEFVSLRTEKILGQNALLLEADGALMVVPFSSIKYMQLFPIPQKLPNYVIKEATVDA